MIITPRTKEILLLLIENVNSYISVNEIANNLNVTNRTVYRQLEEVYDVIENFDLEITNTAGKGMKLSGSVEELEKINSLFESNDQIYEVSTEDRINSIVFHLLHEQEFIKAEYFSEILNVSIQSIRNDFQQIKKEYF